jgi:hypothetical protein
MLTQLLRDQPSRDSLSTLYRDANFMKFVHFTAPNGSTVPINPDQVSGLKENDGTYHPDARTVIVLGGSVQAVRESLAEVEKALGAN